MSLVGETSVTSAQEDEYRVQMLLSGSLLEPRVDFNSDSGLRREEIQALLGVTTSFEALELLRKGKEARSLSELVNPASGLGIRDRLAGLTGFTSVQLETALSPISGEFVPRLVGKRPVIGSVEAELATQLGAEQASEVRIKYPLRPHLDFLAGWYTPAVTRPGASASGSIYGGIGYHRAFPGAYILPSGFLDWELFQ